jgi:hypothetical protein
MDDYRNFKSVSEYREAVAAAGGRFGICCAWPLSQLMARDHLGFPEAFEKAFGVGMLIPTDRGLRRLLRKRGVLK